MLCILSVFRLNVTQKYKQQKIVLATSRPREFTPAAPHSPDGLVSAIKKARPATSNWGHQGQKRRDMITGSHYASGNSNAVYACIKNEDRWRWQKMAFEATSGGLLEGY